MKLTLRLLAEEVSVDRELVETGRVRVRVVTREHDEMVDVPLARHTVEVERVPVENPAADTRPRAGVDGNATSQEG